MASRPCPEHMTHASVSQYFDVRATVYWWYWVTWGISETQPYPACASWELAFGPQGAQRPCEPSHSYLCPKWICRMEASAPGRCYCRVWGWQAGDSQDSLGVRSVLEVTGQEAGRTMQATTAST